MMSVLKHLARMVGGVLVAAALSGIAQAQTQGLSGQWVVQVHGDERRRALVIAQDGEALHANYGWADQKAGLRLVEASVDGKGALTLRTPADSVIVASPVDDNTLKGTITTAKGKVKDVTIVRANGKPDSAAVASADGSPGAAASVAQATALAGLPAPKIQMIYMGGNDCPPCVAWRGLELPKLEKTAVFKSIQFLYVTKAVGSTVPSLMFLPADVKPYKEQLDVAGAGNGGSSQTAIMVNGEVFDYYFGTRSTSEIEERLLAIRAGGRYPFARCLELQKRNARQCARRVRAS